MKKLMTFLACTVALTATYAVTSFPPNPSNAFGYLGGTSSLAPCGEPTENTNWVRIREVPNAQFDVDYPSRFPPYGYGVGLYEYTVAPNWGTSGRNMNMVFNCQWEGAQQQYSHTVNQSAPANLIERIIAFIVYLVGGYWLF